MSAVKHVSQNPRDFDYATEAVAAEVFITRRYGVTRQTAHRALEHAVDSDRHKGRGYVIWITDDAELTKHTVHIADAYSR